MGDGGPSGKSGARSPRRSTDRDLAVLDGIQRRVLWLSTWMVHHANAVRPGDGTKVGGHQASSASVVSLLTALYFHALRPEDAVAVKAHASPAFYAIQYLRGRLGRGGSPGAAELRGAPGLSEPPQEPGDRRHLHGIDGARRRAGHLRRPGHALPRRPRPGGEAGARHRHGGRRRAGRGQRVGGAGRGGGGAARQRAVDRRRQPPEPRPHRPRRAAPPAPRAVPDVRMERDRAALRIEVAGPLRAAGRQAAARAAGRHALRGIPEPPAPARGRGAQGAGDRRGRRDRPRARSSARVGRRRCAARAPRRSRRARSRADPRRARRGRPASRRPQRHRGPHHQGLGASPRRRSHEPHRAAHHRADRGAARLARHQPG